MTKTFLSRVLALAIVFSMVSSNGGFLQILTARADDNGWKSPSADFTIGGSVGHPERAYASDDNRAEYDSNEDVNSYYGFGTTIVPSGATVNGIQVSIEGKRDSDSSRKWDISLSYDGGSHWTASKNTGSLGTSDSTIILGTSGDNWGYGSWTPTKINGSTNFRVKIDATSGGESIWLDQVKVKVYYTPACTPTTWYQDSDNDGYGNPSASTQSCSAPQGYVANNTDCNDTQNTIHPGATETCNNLDDDCDDTTDEDFANKEQTCTLGVGACQTTGSYVCSLNGLSTQCDAVAGTPVAEICGDGIDQDCDGADLACAFCGDGHVDPGETCDDGDLDNGDGCAATCTVESGWTCTGTQPSVCTQNPPSCGDGTVNPGEACDDGDVSDGDGCTANCTVESGWTCIGTQPSVCTQTPPSCGDGNLDTDEECDDGNEVNDDGCSNTCHFVVHYSCSPTGAGCVQTPGGSFTTSTCDNQCGGPNNLPIEIIAKKVICAAEQYLPNWGNGGPDIDGNTAQTYVTESQQKCWLEDQWGFEWALGNVSNPGDNIIGPAGGSWTSFGTGSANSAMISDLGGTDKIWVREILPNADYIDFTGANTTQDVSAEFYCASDVLNYDNYDYINNPQYQSTYNCVGFNALKQRCGNGVREGTEECDGADGVNPTANLDFCSTSCNLVPIYNRGTECPEGTKPEKVGNTYIINSSNATETEVTVEENKQYIFAVSGTFSPTSAQGYLSDAGYTLVNDVLSTQYGIQGTPPDLAAHALLGDLGLDMGIINWGAYNPDHLYDFSYTIPTGTTTAKFVVGDRYGDWFDTPYQMQAGIGDNIGTLNLNVYKCVSDIPPVESDVTICKQDPQQTPLSGWNMILKGSLVEDLTVYPYNEAKNNFALVTSSGLPTGNYIVEANGQYIYRPGAPGAEYSDAGYSKRLCPGDAPALCSGPYSPWANVTTLDSPYQGYLGLMVNEGSTDWGYFNSGHKYVLGYPNHTGSLSFTIKDDQYSDNSGFLTASIYNGYADVTDENGCVTFANVPVGTYSLEEIMQNNWQNVSGLETITVDDETETFYVVNDIIRKGSVAGYKVNDLDRDNVYDSNPDEAQGMNGWTIYLDLDHDEEFDQQEPSQITGGTGFYRFEDINNGGYQICEVMQSGWNSDNLLCQTITVESDVQTQFDHEARADFFNYQPAGGPGALTACKYNDIDRDGEYDLGTDTPLSWNIRLWYYPNVQSAGWQVASNTTDSTSGCVTFNDLAYGIYTVHEDQTTGWTQTAPTPDGSPQVVISETNNHPHVTFLNYSTAPVDGGWTDWGACSVACGGGTQTRTCTNPAPANEGAGCTPENASQSCNTQACGPAPTFIGLVGTSGGTTGGGASPAVAGVSTESTEPASEVLGASTGTCDLYLYKYIKLGANNDPEEVRKLQLFLNEYLNLNLPVDGVYSQDDYDAVATFQLTYKDDILKPWADLGLLLSANDPTGYVYRTTQRKINLIVCPGLGLAMPDLTNEIGGLGGFGTSGSVLGESTEAITTTSTTVTTATTKPEDESVIGALEETGGKNLNWFLIFMGLLIVGGGLYALVLRKKK